MNQKQRVIFVIKAIVLDEVKDEETKNHLIEKLDSCLELANPDVLLSLKQLSDFNQLVEKAKKQGKIL